VVCILAGFMMLPHAAGKFAAGGLNPGTAAFFAVRMPDRALSQRRAD
jgi:hypothetical protein